MGAAEAQAKGWGPRSSRTLFGHPLGLFILFFTEMWERFSYYGMRGLLKLYMVNYLFVTSRQMVQGGHQYAPGNPDLVFGWTWLRSFLPLDVQGQASVIYGWYTGLVYLTPVLGGLVADRYLGQRKTVVIGGLLMAIGQFLLPVEQWFFFGLTFLIVGNGAFKPNISTQVGSLYPADDPRRDGAFTIFYMGINLGAFLCNLVCGTLAAIYGWRYGFSAAGVGMLIGVIVYLSGQRYLAKDSLSIKKEAKAAQTAPAVKQPLTSDEWKRIGALAALCLLNVVFWAVYEQQGNTMQTWADEKTVWPVIAGFAVPSTWFQSANPLFIFLMAPVLDAFWMWQSKRRGADSSSVKKMVIGCFILGFSFIVMVIGARVVGDGKGSLFWPIFCTFLLTIGELYLSPVGLSLVTKVSPVRIVSTMMGIWFLSSFLGNILSGYIGTLYSHMSKDMFFLVLMALGIGAGLAMWVMVKPLKKAMGSHSV